MKDRKDICQYLKTMRQQIAAENGIVLESPECTYEGPCRGTCPRCEAEARYLENALADRLRLGRVATVAGLALGLAASAQAMTAAPNATAALAPTPDEIVATVSVQGRYIKVKGQVVDKKTKEPIPFCAIEFFQDGERILRASTDFDGKYSVQLPAGTYTVSFGCIGYSTVKLQQQQLTSDTMLPEVSLDPAATLLGMVEVIEDPDPVITIDPNGGFSSEIQGVTVIVK